MSNGSCQKDCWLLVSSVFASNRACRSRPSAGTRHMRPDETENLLLASTSPRLRQLWFSYLLKDSTGIVITSPPPGQHNILLQQRIVLQIHRPPFKFMPCFSTHATITGHSRAITVQADRTSAVSLSEFLRFPSVGLCQGSLTNGRDRCRNRPSPLAPEIPKSCSNARSCGIYVAVSVPSRCRQQHHFEGLHSQHTLSADIFYSSPLHYSRCILTDPLTSTAPRW